MTPSRFVLLLVLASGLCWVLLMTSWLAGWRHASGRLMAAPSLLGIAAFAPLGLALASGSSVNRSSLTGSELARTTWMLLLLYLLAVSAVVVGSQLGVPRPSRVDAGIFLLVCAYWLLGAVSNSLNGFPVARLSFFATPVIFAAALAFRPRYGDALRVLTYGALGVCAASLLLAIYEPSVAFTDPSRTAILFSDRLAGIVSHPNGLGLIASLGVVLGWHARGLSRWLVTLPCLLTLVASDSRNAWFACGVALMMLMAGSRLIGRRRGPVRARLLFALMLIAVGAFWARSQFGQTGNNATFDGRRTVWDFVLAHWRESPLIGHGPGVWTRLMAESQVGPTFGQAHNQVLETLFTTGLAGMVILVALVALWTIKSLRAARLGDWLPLALQFLILSYGLLESPFSIWGLGDNIWVLSLVLFLQPGFNTARYETDKSRASASPRTTNWRELTA